MNLFAFVMPGPMELIIIAVIGVLLFGNRLPKIARSVGSAIPSFKSGLSEVQSELEEVSDAVKKETKS